jgi:Protein of unknown function (DUF3558)
MIAAHRRIAATVVLTGTMLALAACSGQTTGRAAPVTPASATAGGGSATSAAKAVDPLASVDPCSLMPADEIAKNGLTAGKADIEDGARACGWSQPANAFNNDSAGYSVGVRFYEKYGLDEVRARAGAGNPVTNLTIGSHDALQIEINTGLGAGGCAVALGVSSSSSAFVGAAAGTSSQPAACNDADGVATVIEKKLPAETK